MGYKCQVISSLILCYISMVTGILFSWPTTTLLIYISANTTLDRPMQEGELALFTCQSSFIALISTPLAGYLLDTIGRKKSVIIISLLAVLGWVLTATCIRVEVAFVTSFISGLCNAIFIINTVYVSEICQESIRGSMVLSVLTSFGIGMFVSYILGDLISYWPLVYTNLVIAVMGSIGLLFLKETPLYLMTNGLEKEAEEALAFYREVEVDSEEVHTEMENIRRSLNPKLDDDPELPNMLTPQEEKLHPYADKERLIRKKLSIFQFLRKSRSSRKALCISLVLITASVFQGLLLALAYAEPLFVPNDTPTMSTVILAIIVVLAGYLGAFFIKFHNRKPLLIYASIATGFCNFFLASQSQFQWGPDWLNTVILYIFCFCYTVGAGAVPYVFITDVFLPRVKVFANVLTMEWTWLCNFLTMIIFTPMINVMGLSPVFYVFSACCFLTAAFSYFFQPETKGLRVDEAQALFVTKKRNVDKRIFSLS